MHKNEVKRYILSIMPIGEYGEKLIREFGWYNPQSKSLRVPLPSQALILEDRGRGHGSPEDWIEFLKEEHPNWNISTKYIEETT